MQPGKPTISPGSATRTRIDLPYDEQDSIPCIGRRRGNLIEFGKHRLGKIAENALFHERPGQAALDNLQAIRCLRGLALLHPATPLLRHNPHSVSHKLAPGGWHRFFSSRHHSYPEYSTADVTHLTKGRDPCHCGYCTCRGRLRAVKIGSNWDPAEVISHGTVRGCRSSSSARNSSTSYQPGPAPCFTAAFCG